MNIYTYKYNLLSLFSLACVYMISGVIVYNRYEIGDDEKGREEKIERGRGWRR